MKTQNHYHSIRRYMLANPREVHFLTLATKMTPYITAVVYGVVGVGVLIQERLGKETLLYFGIPAIGFMIVTFLRRTINRPRPYEVYDLPPLLTKDTAGHSMPSKHVFSATIMAMAILAHVQQAGICLLMLAILLAVGRVCLGVHYIMDVLVAYGLAIVMGLFMYL